MPCPPTPLGLRAFTAAEYARSLWLLFLISEVDTTLLQLEEWLLLICWWKCWKSVELWGGAIVVFSWLLLVLLLSNYCYYWLGVVPLLPS